MRRDIQARQLSLLESLTVDDLLLGLPAIYRNVGIGRPAHFIRERVLACLTRGEFEALTLLGKAVDPESNALREIFERKVTLLIRDFLLGYLDDQGGFLWDRIAVVATNSAQPVGESIPLAEH